MPLIWTIQRSGRPEDGFDEWIEWLRLDPLEQIRRWYAAASFCVFFVLPIWLFLLFQDLSSRLLRFVTESSTAAPTAAALFLFLTPDAIEIRSWHVARLINIGLTFWLWWYLTRLTVHMRHGSVNADRATRIIGGSLLVRGFLGLFVIGCNIVILGRAVDWTNFPALKFRSFP